jgi:hypothetical protein
MGKNCYRKDWRFLAVASTAACLLACLTSSAACAQEESPAIEEDSSVLEEVIVTGNQFGESTHIKFGVNNITDKEPAFLADAVWANNTSASTYDVFGRSYYVGVNYQFGGN